MKKKDKLGCVLMAAGYGSRFGENKLLADFMGKPLISHALDAIPKSAFKRIVVVSQYPAILRMAEKAGFIAVENTDPSAGVSHTISLGLNALGEVDAAMFMVADQPCLQQDTIKALIEYYHARPGHIFSVGYGKRRGNPTIFPRFLFPELLSLSGDNGGSRVIKAHEDILLLYQVERDIELRDVDCKQELEKLKIEAAKPY